MIEWLRLWAFVLLPLPFLAWWALPALTANAALPVPAAVRDLMVGLSGDGQRRRRNWPDDLGFKLLGWMALIVALAGPQTRESALLIPTGRDLMVAIDLSASMDEADMEQNGVEVPRHEIVREMVGSFIEARKGDRVGLIAFGHEAYLIAPLTFDTSAVSAMLAELTIGLPGHRTDLGRAVGLTIQSFKNQPKAERVLVLLSDGEDNSGELTGADAADMAQVHDIRIHTIGFSSEIDTDGAAVLKSMAEETGGIYYRADSAEALADISGRIDDIEPSASETDEEYVMRNWAIWFIFLALTAVTGIIVQEMRRR